MMHDKLKNPGDKYRDFTLVKRVEIQELRATLRELVHGPTGAEVMHIENDDPENLFCLSFRTYPSSSNGVAHILEHTVLCGSRKFPVKDPFFAMNRRSLNTFMNALTGSDFTCYPAATQVEKDFYNLLDVYLDAVFHPLLKEVSFLQEGHRLEFTSPKDPSSSLEIKGIVYNEMKGGMASIESRIWHTLMEMLVPDLPYAFNSGGDPKSISELTYQDLIQFHEKYYHPSRCLFFFYGNFSLLKHLDFIEEHTLKHVQRVPDLSLIPMQKRFYAPVKRTISYPLTETKHLEKKLIVCFGWLTAALLNQEEVLGLNILDSVLMDTDASLLKKALLDSNLCVQADSYIDNEMSEVPFTIVCKGCEKKNIEKLEKTVKKALQTIYDEGIERHLLEAAIHQLEFSRTEIGADHSPFGLVLFMRSGLAKQHGCAPENALVLHALFKTLLKQAKDPHYFRQLLKKYFIDNLHFVRLVLTPDPELNTKEMKEEQKHLASIKKSLNEKQIAKILDQTDTLKQYQEQIENQKVSCLPKVTLDDVPTLARNFKLHHTVQKNLQIFHHECFTNQILYADLILEFPEMTEQELLDAKLFATLLPELGANKRTYLSNLEFIQAHTGGIGIFCTLFSDVHHPQKTTPCLQIRGKALKRNVSKLFELFEDILKTPRLDEKKRIKQLIEQLASALQNRLSRNGLKYATQLALSGFSIPNHIGNLWHGIPYYKYIQDMVENLTKSLPKILGRLLDMKEKLLITSTPHLIISCDAEMYKELDKEHFFALPNLPLNPAPSWQGNLPIPSINSQARVIASPVAFTTEAFQTVTYLDHFSPALLVATFILENKILHRRVREQGGAYGVGASFNPLLGNFYLHSYRDPHIARTLRTFHESVEALASKNFDETDLEEAKLGVVQQLDAPVSPENRAMVAYHWKKESKTQQMRQSFRDRLLNLTIEEVQASAQKELLPKMKQSVIVSLANKELLEKENALIAADKQKSLPIFSI